MAWISLYYLSYEQNDYIKFYILQCAHSTDIQQLSEQKNLQINTVLYTDLCRFLYLTRRHYKFKKRRIIRIRHWTKLLWVYRKCNMQSQFNAITADISCHDSIVLWLSLWTGITKKKKSHFRFKGLRMDNRPPSFIVPASWLLKMKRPLNMFNKISSSSSSTAAWMPMQPFSL